MSNEELFVAIHKSKKKLNIKLNETDSENLSPYGSMNSLVKTSVGTRHSWSPESQKASLEVIVSPKIIDSKINLLLSEKSLITNSFNRKSSIF